MRTALQHRRWLRFELAAKRPPFVGLHVLHYLRRMIDLNGRSMRVRKDDALWRKKRQFKRLRPQLGERRQPKWATRWKTRP